MMTLVLCRPFLDINGVNRAFFFLFRRIVPLIIPLTVQEVRESTSADMDKFVEDSWDDCLSLDFEVERSLVR